jgi:lysophospholipase L1-like esterase
MQQLLVYADSLSWGIVPLTGTNDFQSMHPHDAWHSSQGIAALVSAIRTAPIEPGMPVPQVLVVAPPPIRAPKGPIAPKFAGGDAKCVGLADAYRKTCDELGCRFFDSATAVSASKVDGVHLDAEQHLALGRALVAVVEPLLSRS